VSLTISYEPPRTEEAVKRLWDRVPETRGRDPESIRRALDDTSLTVAAWDGDTLVGLARVLTDGVYYAVIVEVVVDPTYTDPEVATRLVDAAADPFRRRGFRHIGLWLENGAPASGFSAWPYAFRLDEKDPGG
jgi:ribosomal protein S18 acetylase RimI-like enzyme